MTTRDYYEALGVPRTADDAAIKSAYRKMALKYHPDQNPDDTSAEERFKEAAEAYAILADREKRSRYDRFGHAGVGGGAGGGGGFDPTIFAPFDDILGGLGDLFGFGGGTRLGESLKMFNDSYAKRALNSRTVFMILSDGYDTGPPEVMAGELKRLKKRVRRIVWLNPVLGWRDYEPITKAMALALPMIDHFCAANTLESLAAIEIDIARM